MPDLLDRLTDTQRVALLLHIHGASYDEIAEELETSARAVRGTLEIVMKKYPSLLDHRRPKNRNRSLRLAYVLGLQDAGVPVDDLTDWLDSLVTRASWLRARAPYQPDEESTDAGDAV